MRVLRWIGIGLGGLVLLAVFLLWIADTSIGHRFIADQIAAQAPASGLKLRVGRIDGSIYSKARLKDVRLYDPNGLFFHASETRLHWTPAGWLANRLDITSLDIPAATLHKLPKLRPSGKKRPILPGFDIRIGSLKIDRLAIEPGVAGGKRRIGRLAGSADIRKGRALIKLNADAAAGDRLTLLLDAEPDGNRFDFDADLSAPGGGVFGQIVGTVRPVALKIEGDGDWTRWRGSLRGDVSGARIAQLALTNDKGVFALDGRLALASITRGKLQRLTAPALRVRGDATLENRRLAAKLGLASQALIADLSGTIDLANNRFSPLNVDARLLQPPALFPNMTGRDVTLKARFDGAFSGASFDYLLTAPFVAFDKTGFEMVRASGQGRLGKSPVIVPLKLTARRITGVGDVAGGILANISVIGPLSVSSKALVGDGLVFRSDKLSGKLTLFVDLVTGRYDVGLAGQLARYLIPGLGIVDVKSELKVIPGAGGRGSLVVGRGQAWVRRLDNAFLVGLTRGLPVIDTGLTRGPDGIVHFVNLKLTSPGLVLNGNGLRRRDGTFYFEGSGRQAQYGTVTRLVLDGRIERPRIDMMLAHPNEAMGLSNVHLLLDPDAKGFAWRADGGSRLGAFSGNGSILLPTGAPATIVVAGLTASKITAKGALRSLTGGFAGQLALTGGGVNGTLDFAPAGDIQRIEAHVKARDATLEGPPVITARRGTFDGVLLLDPRGTSVEGALTGQGLSYGGVRLARLAANVKLRGGAGEVRASLAGSRGRAFDLQTVAQIGADRIELAGSGTIDRKPVRLASAAVLTREGGGWRMQPTSLEFAGGRARISGLFGGNATEFGANVSQMPLSIVDMLFPKSGLGGSADGTVSYRQATGELPSGRADLRVRGLTRSGLVLSSRPVDVGLTAVLTAGNAAARAVAVSGGQTIGRGQVQIRPGAGSDLTTRLENGKMFAQLRFNGAADTLWRLTGIKGFDVSGPVSIGADITGSAANPVIRGSVRTTNARLESAATGMVLTGIKASGQFGGSKLVIDNFTGAAGGGIVSGRGSVDFTRGQRLGMNLALQTANAVLIARDDLGATVTGPIAFASDGKGGGVISGDVELVRSAFRLGRATAAAAIPRLNVKEVNAVAEDRALGLPSSPWRLAIKARAANRLSVTGLGIESEWRADLNIGGSITEPAINGRADLVRGGYEFAGRRFDLERGTIRFQGEVPADPTLDIVATGDTQGLKAVIRVSGTGQRPEIAFSSVPALPEDELLSRLLFGTSITNLSAPEALQLAAAVASLQGGGNGLNPINALRNAIGLDRLRILPADTVTGQKTSVAAGKYITRRTYVEIITDGQGYSATRAEFQITRWLSVLSSISTIGRQSATIRVSRDY
jgi:translocation and assembly module TamB